MRLPLSSHAAPPGATLACGLLLRLCYARAHQIADAAAPKATTRKADGERKGGSKKARAADDDDEPQIRLTMQFPLKKQLVDDWEHIAQRHDLVKLPRTTSVDDVLMEYVESRKRKGRVAENKIVQEVATGIRHYFNRALGRLLLYRFERQQYHEVMARLDEEGAGSRGAEGGAGGGPSALASVYGPEHLLRLFVKLPALLAHTDLEPNELELLNARLHDFLKFMHKNAARYFRDSYARADETYIAAFTKAT